MSLDKVFRTENETKQQIMEATFEALLQNGYSELSIQEIADRFDKSKSLLYHHYNGKDELLLEFLEKLLEEFEGDICGCENRNHREELEKIVMLPFELSEDERKFAEAITELRSNAIHDQRYRERFDRFDQLVSEEIEETIAAGIQENELQNVNEERFAQLFTTLITGTLFRSQTTSNDLEESRRMIEEVLEEELFSN